MRYVGLLGYPLRHSLSAVFQQAALDALGLDLRYQPWEVPPEEVPAAVAALRGPDRLGMNVTIPYKETVIPLLDGLSRSAARIGAVNTIVRQGDALVGYNTDAPGFLRALRDDAGFAPAGRRALLLGAGGAARAVAFALLEAGAWSLVVTNRSPERASRLAAELAAVDRDEATGPGGRTGVQVALWTPTALAQVLQGVDLVVNCTPIGMRHSDGEGQSPLEGVLLPSHVLYCDLVYNPEQTPFLWQAAAAGAATLGGLPMLIYQGAEAFRMWTGMAAPVEVMFAAARKALQG
ncbi:MAG: shikimate dehydrogenase [Chloroflexi bacterium]|nr:shikimate dehydrogenase [Chloroflexota bacterium]